MTSSSILLIACLCGLSGVAGAHGGGLNAEGFHNDRKNGGYHCHRGPAAGSPPARGDSFAQATSSRNNFSGATGAYANCAAARAAGGIGCE